MRADADRERPSGHALRCWYCGFGLEVDDVVQGGILRSRAEKQGGPYRLFGCPRCLHMNLCEKTPRGRWFSSPSFRPNLLDYLIGRLFLPDPEDFLRAAAWYRENEERRRYFFERDGDRRYSHASLLSRLWPIESEEERKAKAKGRPQPAGGRRTGGRERTGSGSAGARPRPGGERKREKDGPRERPGEERRRAPPRDEPPRRPRVPSPWEILGLREGASEVEIRSAFHRLALQYHPDKVHHLGDEFQKVATLKFKELQRSYEALLARRAREGE